MGILMGVLPKDNIKRGLLKDCCLWTVVYRLGDLVGGGALKDHERVFGVCL